MSQSLTFALIFALFGSFGAEAKDAPSAADIRVVEYVAARAQNSLTILEFIERSGIPSDKQKELKDYLANESALRAQMPSVVAVGNVFVFNPRERNPIKARFTASPKSSLKIFDRIIYLNQSIKETSLQIQQALAAHQLEASGNSTARAKAVAVLFSAQDANARGQWTNLAIAFVGEASKETKNPNANRANETTKDAVDAGYKFRCVILKNKTHARHRIEILTNAGLGKSYWIENEEDKGPLKSTSDGYIQVSSMSPMMSSSSKCVYQIEPDGMIAKDIISGKNRAGMVIPYGPNSAACGNPFTKAKDEEAAALIKPDVDLDGIMSVCNERGYEDAVSAQTWLPEVDEKGRLKDAKVKVSQ